MNTAELIEQIKASALGLSKSEREKIASELFAAGEEIAELDASADDDMAPEFMDELERRIESVRNGTAELIPADVVFAELRALFPER